MAPPHGDGAASAQSRATASTARRSRRKTSPRAGCSSRGRARAASRSTSTLSAISSCGGRDATPHAPPVMTGSHMDSQPRGGRFDGIYGVLAGLEALEAIDEAGVTTRRPIEVVAWTNEEGGRFQPCTMGSAVYTGARSLEEVLDVRDNDGRGAAVTRCGRRSRRRRKRKSRAFNAPAAAYIEAHIEQGPLLEKAGKTDRRRHRHPGPALVQRRGVRQDRPRRHDAGRACARTRCATPSRSSTRSRS